MATLEQKIRCEQAAREMLRRDDVPEPDRVEYGHTCIRLIWNEAKVALVVEIDKPPEGFEVVGKYLGDLDLDDDEDADDDFEYDDAAEELERLDKGDRDEGEQMD